MPRSRDQHAIKRFFACKEIRDREPRSFLQSEVKPCDVESGQVQSVVKAVPIRVVLEKVVMPRFEIPAQHQIQLQMHMRAHLVQSLARMTHHAELVALPNPIASPDRDRAEVA